RKMPITLHKHCYTSSSTMRVSSKLLRNSNLRAKSAFSPENADLDPGLDLLQSKRTRAMQVGCMSTEKESGLLGLDLQQLTSLMEAMGEPSYRSRQLFEALYQGRVSQIEDISTLPLELRRRLVEQGFQVGQPKIQKKFVSSDGTVRYLLAMSDRQSVEAVWMPEGDDGEAGDGSEAGDATENHAVPQRDRATICISSQVGCAVDCQFCLTALLGAKRNLTAGEIAGQVCAVLQDQRVIPPQHRVNLVFMG